MEHKVPPTPIISDGYQSFYDPNSYFAGFFGFLGECRLLRHLEKNRTSPVYVDTPDGSVPYSGKELIALELAHTMLISGSDYEQAKTLGLDESTLQRAVEVANFGATQIVKGVKAAVDILLEDDPELAQLTKERDPMHLLPSGAVLAAVSHRGQKRRSGRDYVEHTIATAGIAGIAARKSSGEIVDSHEILVLRLLQYALLNHDGFEDSMESSGPNRGRSFLASERVVPSPLTHYTLLQSLGVSPELSFAEARNIYMVSKPVGPERKGRMKYDKYVDRFFEFIEANVMKMADIHDNLRIDPKRVHPVNMWHTITRNRALKIKNQQNNYNNVFNDLESHVAESDADPLLKRIAGNIRSVEPEDLDVWRQAAISVRILNLLNNNKLLDAWDMGQQRQVA